MSMEASLTRLTRRPGRLAFALASLALTMALAGPVQALPDAVTPAAALVCKMQPTGRKGWLCWCRGPYGWKPAPKILCQLAG